MKMISGVMTHKASCLWLCSLLMGVAVPSIHAQALVPTGPTVVIDTTMGRLTCKLFEKEAPVAVANFIALAEGKKEWTDPVSGAKMTGKRFYDGTVIAGSSSSYIVGGDRLGNRQGTAGYTFANEIVPGLNFDIPGRLAMVNTKPDGNSSQFLITSRPAKSLDGRMPIFGQCDEASAKRAAAITRFALTTDSDPNQPVVINRVTIVRQGQPLPRVAANVKPILPPAMKRPADGPEPDPTGPSVIIETSMGKITCKLYTKQAPITSGVFIGLADGTLDWTDPVTKQVVHGKPFYDGSSFHRVIPDFMAQGGGRPGGGGPGWQYKDEGPTEGITFYRAGRLAMANAGPNTNGSQFYVTEHPVRRLSKAYTVFGQCDDASVRLEQQIARVRRDSKDKPLDTVVIYHIQVLNDGDPVDMEMVKSNLVPVTEKPR
jgi:cyclophilin family peptidyl-prolyl cis-trans isomerase